jgi:protein-S-isoprenylcysteine O-methyltransferase Ste14
MPPTLFYFCIILMVLLTWLWPARRIIDSPFNILGVVPLCVGVGISIWGSQKFESVGTTIKTFDEPNELVTDGLFQLSRNPMYLGFALALLGIWMIQGALSPLVGVIVFVVVTDRWYIPFEERMLSVSFGPEFERYRSRTRRWI